MGKILKKQKFASAQIGFAIIVMALLLLMGGIFVDNSNPNSKDVYLHNKNVNNNYNSSYPEESYLFYLNDTDIGRQKKVTESFSNIVLGSKIEHNIIYFGNSFILNANPFTANKYEFVVNIPDYKDVTNLMFYFNSFRSTGDQNLIIKIDGHVISNNQARPTDLPVLANIKFNKASINVSFELEKPAWYDIFNWNKMSVTQLKIASEKQNKDNEIRNFNFQLNKENLERAYFELVVSCEDDREVADAIEVEVNGHIISNTNPNCRSRYNRISAEIPLSVLKNNNSLVLKSKGYYKVGYSLNKIYFNDQDIYKFNLNSYNDIIDVIIYGDFDKDIIDLKINDQLIDLKRNEIESILNYLKLGTNEIEILTKPVEIEELIVEKNEFIY